MTGWGNGTQVRAWGRAAAAIALITGTYFAIPLEPADIEGGPWPLRVIGALAALTLLTWLVAYQARRALRPGRRMVEQVTMLFTLVDLVVVSFAVLYVLMDEQFIGIGTRLDALYFSVVTLCTVGYGDISPTGQAARGIVTVQMLFDLVIVTSAISLVVTGLRKRAEEKP